MSSCNDVMRTAGRFALWDVLLGPSVDSKTSNPFTMGPWSWKLSVQRDYAHTSVSLLSQEPPPPVAGMDRVVSISFQSLHEYRDRGSAAVTRPQPREVLLDRNCGRGLIWTVDLNCGRGLIWTVDLKFVSASFVIKFIDVKLRNEAHRAVLAARSPVFMRMFSIDLKEKEQSMVDISDMSLEACQAFIAYIYGCIPEEEFLPQRSELISAADKYDIVELKNMCERSMIDDTDNDNVLERLQIAHLYGLSTLKKVCMWLLVGFLKIYDTPEDFREFMRKGDPDLVAEVMQSCKGHGYRLRCWLQCNYQNWIHPILNKDDHK